VARVTPQPAVHHAAGARGVRLEARELPVAHALEHEAHDPEQDAEGVEHPERRRLAGDGADQRRRDDPGQRGLQREHEVQALPGEARLVAPADCLVARVLFVPMRADAEVQCEPQRPGRDERQQQRRARFGRRCRVRIGQRREQEEQRPERVDDGDVAQCEAREPRGHGRTEQDRHGLQPDFEQRRHRPLPAGVVVQWCIFEAGR
jgi:hypothetical protein